MIPWYLLILAYLYGVICAASVFLGIKYTSIFSVNDWLVAGCFGWFVAPITWGIGLFKKTSKWISDHW